MLPQPKLEIASEVDEQERQREFQFHLPDDAFVHLEPPVSDCTHLGFSQPPRDDCEQFDWIPDFPLFTMET